MNSLFIAKTPYHKGVTKRLQAFESSNKLLFTSVVKAGET
jgi:hypothetical protein